jgi:hypothetical protein
MITIRLPFFQRPPPDFTGIVIRPSGAKEWLQNGLYHRPDGPAVEIGRTYKAWYLDGDFLGFEKYWERQKDTEYAPRIMAYMLGAKT